MVNLPFSWGFIEILRYQQTARIKPLTENCACTFDTPHHGSDQSKPHSIGFLKEKFGVHTLSLASISMITISLMIKCSKLFVRKAANHIKLLVILLNILLCILLNMFGNFGRIFFQAVLVGCFFNERKLLYLGYGGILPWTGEIPSGWDGMKNIPTSYKRNSKFLKKWL